MKISIVSHQFPTRAEPSVGTFILDHYNLIKSHLDARVVNPVPYKLPFSEAQKKARSAPFHSPEAEKVQYFSLPGRKFPGLMTLDLQRKTIPVIRKHQPDIVHIHWAYPDGLLIPECKRRGWRVVLSIHGSDWTRNRERKQVYRRIVPAILQADKILTVGKKLKESILEELPQLENRVEFLPNAIDTSYFRPGRLQQTGKSDQKTKVLCVAKIRRVKGIDVLLDAIEKLPNPEEFEFNIIGHTDNSPYCRHQLNRIKEMTPVVKLYPPVSHENLLSWYQQSDFFVLPSRTEGFGIVLAEAASCGLPLVATRSGGPEDIINKQNGLLAEPENPESLKQSILQMAKRVHQYDSQQIRNSIVERFDQNIIRNKLLYIYKKIAEKN